MDLGIIATGIAALTAFFWGRGKFLRNILLLSWIGSAIGWISGATMSSTVAYSAFTNIAIAGAAVAISTKDRFRYDARVIGGLSIVVMPAHWIMSVSQGAGSWLVYATASNVVFIAQCLIVRGWADGLGRGIGDFFDRYGRLHPVRRGGR